MYVYTQGQCYKLDGLKINFQMEYSCLNLVFLLLDRLFH